MTTHRSHKKRAPFKTRILRFLCFVIAAGIILIVSLYFANKDFATEVRQVRQAKPNHFTVGIDVSQTIKPDTLADFKGALIVRLKKFTGQAKAFYTISAFGLPGCGNDSIATVVSTRSSGTHTPFSKKVRESIEQISIAKKTQAEGVDASLTTPLYRFLDQILTEKVGQRVVIFSDLVNDERDCHETYPFPFEALRKFAASKESQIIFLYCTPYATGTPTGAGLYEKLIKEQKDFIMEMKSLTNKGKVRAFFYHIPNDPLQRVRFLQSQLQKSIPATTFEIIWERFSKMIDTIVGAVRG